MHKSEILSYSCSKFNATAIIKLAVSKTKMWCSFAWTCYVHDVVYEGILIHSMIFNFFHTFSSISRDIFIVTLYKIHRYTWNFMRYKMIYFLSHKFTSKNLPFSPFYEHFRQLREKYAFKLLIKYIMIISSLSSFWWCAYLQIFFKKPTHTHWTIRNIILAVYPFHCFFAKS